SHVPLQTRKPIATVATPMLDFTGLGILQEAQMKAKSLFGRCQTFRQHRPNVLSRTEVV
ncbi:hypothetical protein AAKU64_002270, partial [Undibacterium sp. GrIS 1.8]